MKILLGGIPLGCDNIGDEAILACVAGMLRETVPDVELTVATRDAGTAERLGVEVVPPYGFAGVPVNGFGAVAAQPVKTSSAQIVKKCLFFIDPILLLRFFSVDEH